MKTIKKWALVATTVLAMSCSKDDPIPAPTPTSSSAKVLISLQFTQLNNPNLTASYTAVIDETAKTAKVIFPYQTNVSTLKPNFTVSDKATLKIGADVQTSNSSVWNLTTALTLTVTAENGTTQAYVLTTVVELPSDPILADAITHFGKAVYKADFPVAKLKDLTYETTINANTWLGTATDVGGTPANAIVLLVFDKVTGLLYTPKRYNAQFNTTAIASTAGIEELFTDLATYKQVTGLTQATAEYAQHTFTLANNGTPFWIFDAYASSFATNASKEAAIVANLAALPDGNNFTVQVPQWAKLGNIVYYYIIYQGNRYQQTSCIVQETNGMHSTIEGQLLNTGAVRSTGAGTQATYMTDATGTLIYNANNVNGRSSFWLSSLTAAQKSDIAAIHLQESQPISKPYKLTLSTVSRYSTAHYYAGKLQWQAYMNVGVNIDGNGGSFVFGDDIILNSIFSGVKF